MMSPLEITVIIFGGFIGYWLVSHFTASKPPDQKTSSNSQSQSKQQNTCPDMPPNAWHQVLQVSPNANYDQVRAAYQSLIRQYHPDKVAGLGEELRALSEHKTKEINVAYQQALRELGVSA